MRRFMLIVEVEEGTPNEAIMASLTSIGQGIRFATLEMPIIAGLPSCLRREADGDITLSVRNPLSWPIIAPLATLILPDIQSKVNELIVNMNHVRSLHVQ